MFTQHLKEYRESGFLSDLTVEVGKQRFRLHKLVMASSSKYFCGLVQSEMSDSNHVSIPELPGGEQSMELVADLDWVFGSSVLKDIGINCKRKFFQLLQDTFKM
jgi:hypothetical protein